MEVLLEKIDRRYQIKHHNRFEKWLWCLIKAHERK